MAFHRTAGPCPIVGHGNKVLILSSDTSGAHQIIVIGGNT
jgi:hypothetical protein